MPLILPARTLDSGYEIDNSLRFNSPDVGSLGKTISGTSNRKTFSLSFWLKKSHNDGNGGIMGVGTASSDTGKLNIKITGSDVLTIEGGATNYRITNRAFRDNSAWYNIFISFDSTQSTADNRISIYVNGVEETSFSTKNNPSQDANTPFNEDGKTHYIGTEGNGSSSPLDGYLAEFHYIDGTRKAHSDFGEFNDNGVWIPKKYNGSYGTHGFYFQFQDSGNLGDDTSGNGNDYTATNLTATDQTTDTPTNNFCTLNPLINSAQNGALSEGNTKLVSGSASWGHKLGTMAVTNGKWYYEAKVTSSTGNHYVGWQDIQPTQAQNAANPQSDSSGTTIWFTNTANDTTGFLRKNDTDDSAVASGAIANNDIIGLALDLDSGTQTLTIYKNGSAIDSNNTIASGNTGTLVPFIANATSGASIEFNFGNAPFSISSGNSDANGYGNFEYAVPSGYYSLCTKNLAEYG